MTSFQKSKFNFFKKSNFFNKRAIFIGTNYLSVYDWQQGKISVPVSFVMNKRGHEDFRQYLSEIKPLPTYIVIDSMNEEMRSETIPHVFSQKDRKALIKRKQTYLFRRMHYSYAHYLGREKDGRRDDRFLFMAFSNENISFIATLLTKQKTALLGIISFPLLLQSYLKDLPKLSDYALLITIESISGLRQTFFANQQLELSRLSKLPSNIEVETIYSEIDKIQHYLRSVRLIRGDTELDVYFFIDQNMLKKLQAKTKLSSLIREHHIDIDKFLGISDQSSSKPHPFCDQLMFQHLFTVGMKNHYASSYEMRYLKLQKIRYMMNTVSILLLLSSLIFSSANVTNGLIRKQEIDIARQQIDFFKERYSAARQRLPDIQIQSSAVQVGVDTAKLLEEYRAVPTNMLQLISLGLEQFPTIKLMDLDWTTSISYDKKQQPVDDVMVETSTEKQFKYYQISKLNARIEPFKNDREAIEIVNRFAEHLQDYNEVHDVEIQLYPLDVSSEATLHGDSIARNKEARFKLKIVIGVY